MGFNSRFKGLRYTALINLSIFLFGCETWSLTLKKGHRLRVFENRLLRKMFGPKWDEMTGEARRLQNEEFTTCIPPQILSA